MGFSKQEYWSELPCLPPGVLPDPGIEPVSLWSPVLACGFFATSAIWEAHTTVSTEIDKLFWVLGVLDSKGSACYWGDPGSIPGLGRSPGEGNGNPF